MKMSTLFAPTLRDNPAEAEVVSHQLLLRAGYIRRLAAGIYNYLPLMQRVMQKVENIVREEMNRAGAQELLMPILQPAEIWQESGRWEVYGKELIRLKDRHGRDCVLGPTHEEVITTIGKELFSYRQLPVNLYQIQNKYRDEIRPRFGLLRGREFIMKDAYSFHASDACLDKEYNVMADAYKRIFERCGLDTRMVRSDSGAIGGDVSHEFMVLTQTHSGECDVYYCNTCDYAANSNRAESVLPDALTNGSDYFPEEKTVDTPNCTTIEDLCNFLKVPASLICKALLYIKDESEPVLVLIRGDLDVEEVKLQNALGALEVRLATAEEVSQYTGSQKGDVGVGSWSAIVDTDAAMPLHFRGLAHHKTEDTESIHVTIPAIVDSSVMALKNFVIGVNKQSTHKVGFNWTSPEWMAPYAKDVRLARVGDGCPECQGTLEMTRGIEVGNIFKLGTKYSSKMNATYTDETGEVKPFIMGCYGIGVSRTAASAIERFHDKDGIQWPIPIAPYHVVVVPVNNADDVQMTLATGLYKELQSAGIEVVLDDREERAGVKFKDADLLGFPIRVTAGKKAAEGVLEIKQRMTGEVADVPRDSVVSYVKSIIEAATLKPELAHV